MHFSDTGNNKLLRAGHTRAHYALAYAMKNGGKRRKRAIKCGRPQILQPAANQREKYEDFLKIFVIFVNCRQKTICLKLTESAAALDRPPLLRQPRPALRNILYLTPV